MHLRTRLTAAAPPRNPIESYSVGGLVNPDSIRIAIFGVRSADAINPDSIRIEVLVRTHLKAVKLVVHSREEACLRCKSATGSLRHATIACRQL